MVEISAYPARLRRVFSGAWRTFGAVYVHHERIAGDRPQARGQAYRQTRYHVGSRAQAEAAALNAYCSLHAEVPEAEARGAVDKILKASSEAGLIWIEN